jgi:hypothetical protein
MEKQEINNIMKSANEYYKSNYQTKEKIKSEINNLVRNLEIAEHKLKSITDKEKYILKIIGLIEDKDIRIKIDNTPLYVEISDILEITRFNNTNFNILTENEIKHSIRNAKRTADEIIIDRDMSIRELNNNETAFTDIFYAGSKHTLFMNYNCFREALLKRIKNELNNKYDTSCEEEIIRDLSTKPKDEVFYKDIVGIEFYQRVINWGEDDDYEDISQDTFNIGDSFILNYNDLINNLSQEDAIIQIGEMESNEDTPFKQLVDNFYDDSMSTMIDYAIHEPYTKAKIKRK